MLLTEANNFFLDLNTLVELDHKLKHSTLTCFLFHKVCRDDVHAAEAIIPTAEDHIYVARVSWDQ